MSDDNLREIIRIPPSPYPFHENKRVEESYRFDHHMTKLHNITNKFFFKILKINPYV
jgi:hypothetical protein